MTTFQLSLVDTINAATLLPIRYFLTINDLSNEVLQEVLPKKASDLQQVKGTQKKAYFIK